MTEGKRTVGSGRHQVPWLTLGLIGANLVMAGASLIDPDAAQGLAFHPDRPSLVESLASLFLHSNTVHLLGNMLFLAAVGPFVEAVLGRWKTLAVYVAGGLLGVLAHWWVMLSTGGREPVMGASAAIASLVGYSAVRFLSRRVPLAPGLSVTVGSVALAWVCLQAVGAFLRLGGAGTTAFWSHLAGFGTGVLLSLALGAHRQASLHFGHEEIERMSERGPAAVAEAALRHLERHPRDARALRRLAAAQGQMGDREHEAETLLRLVDSLEGTEQAGALEELEQAGGWGQVPAVQRLRWAENVKVSSPELAVRLLKSVAVDLESDSRPDALLALALLEDEEARKPLLEELRDKYSLHPAAEVARRKGLIT